jgi:hypothetical protein
MAVAGARGKSLERDVVFWIEVWKQTRGILTLNTHFHILDVGKAMKRRLLEKISHSLLISMTARPHYISSKQ